MTRYVADPFKSTLVRVFALLCVIMTAGIEPLYAQDRLYADPRGVPPEPPHALLKGLERFYPHYGLLQAEEGLVTRKESPYQLEISTVPGRCYVVMAVAPAEEDIDLRVEEPARGVVALALSRDSYPAASWCAHTTTARIELTTLARRVDTSMAILLKPDTRNIPKLETNETVLQSRLLALWSKVAPRWAPVGQPQSMSFSGPAILPVSFPFSTSSCRALVAVGSEQIKELDLVHTRGQQVIQDSFREGDQSVLLVCGRWQDGDQIKLGVRRGNGEVLVQTIELKHER